MPIPIILGTDWCQRNKITIKFGGPMLMEILDREVPLTVRKGIGLEGLRNVHLIIHDDEETFEYGEEGGDINSTKLVDDETIRVLLDE